MNKLIIGAVALIALTSCSQKKNAAQPAPGQQVGLWLTTEEKGRYDAAQLGGEETCVAFNVQLKNGRQVVRQAFALKILDNGQSELCNVTMQTSDKLDCYGIKERVDLRTGKAEISREGGACEAQAKADEDILTISSVCGKDSKSETGTYFRVSEQGFLAYLKWADICREKLEPEKREVVED